MKDIQKNFSPLENCVNLNILFSHDISRGTLKGCDKVWIRKEMEDSFKARIELMAQEFFRLIIPHQPETRVLKNHLNVYYVLSEEVPGYRQLPTGEHYNFANETYSGLGQALVCSMFLQEIDLKNGNIGLDNRNRVIKIDGDWSFASQQGGFEAQNYLITPNTIESLPLPFDFYTCNWLDYTYKDGKHADSHILRSDIKNSSIFRREVNQAILKICLIPHEFIGRFIDIGMPADGKRFLSLIKDRQELLIQSVLKNESFISYLKTNDAEKDLNELIQQMNTFIVNEEKVIPSEEDILKNDEKTRENFIILKNRILHHKKSPLIEKTDQEETIEIYNLNNTQKVIEIKKDFSLENHSPINDIYDKKNEELLIKILNCSIGEKDKYISDYVNNKRDLIKSMNVFEKKLLRNELKKTLKDVSSAEVIAVKNSIGNYRKTAHFFTRLKLRKADKIETAICNTPLKQRKNIISQNGPANAVQEALASHRALGFGGRVYKNKYNEINLKKAPTIFKKLKEQFSDRKNSQGKNNGKRVFN